MVVSVTKTAGVDSESPELSHGGLEACGDLEFSNLKTLILEGLQQLPKIQQRFVLDFIEFLLERQEFAEAEGLPSAVDCFRQGWADVVAGHIVPLDQLWDGVDDG
ncbi:MAG: hypothetical protein VKK80_08090 [Prochlorothrix sp.]|nr:hypothetical protein [Prochlorothrix sp.]